MVRAIFTALLCVALLVVLVLGGRDWSWEARPEKTIPLAISAVVLLILLIISAPSLMSSWRARGKQGVLDPVQVEELLMTNPPLVLDLRDGVEFKGKIGHIRGSVSIPYAELPKRFEELRSKEPRPIVLADESDKRCYLVADFLRTKGFDWVYILKGGLKAWRRDRLPLYH